MNWKAFEHGWFPVSSLSPYSGIFPEPIRRKRFLNESFALSSSAADTIGAKHSLVLWFDAAILIYITFPLNIIFVLRETLLIMIKTVLF